MKYSLFRTADFQQEEIWRYTYQLWGKEQADRYIAELHNAISEATKNRYLWRKLSNKHLEGVYFIQYKQHYIFFKVMQGNSLGVISLLHCAMDIPKHLKNALFQLNK